MSILRATAAWDSITALPKDRVVNTFHFVSQATPPGPTEFNDVAAAVKNFYDGVHFTSSGVAAILSSRITGTYTLKVFNLDDPEPRVPVHLEVVASTAFSAAGPPLPTEVAICGSYQAAASSGSPQARRRGRIYIGPLPQACVTSTGMVRTNEQLIIRRAMRALVNDTATNWAVYSRRDNAGYLVSNGWVDDAFDIQRRRGVSALVRSLWDGTSP
jgi:hypothetical protein